MTAFTCTALEAEADDPLPIQADGDPVGALPASISLHGEALSLC